MLKQSGQESNRIGPTLDKVLEAAVDKVDSRKLASLRERLERALRQACTEIECGDPMLIRNLLTAQMRAEGSSEGIVQSYEQLFMGVIRRAALCGIIEPPPEGPWTQRWQSVLTTANDFKGMKSEVRALAAWATTQEIEPEAINPEIIKRWGDARRLDQDLDKSKLESVLAEHRRRASSVNDSLELGDRLRKKAVRGSVRTTAEIYGNHLLQNGLSPRQEGGGK